MDQHLRRDQEELIVSVAKRKGIVEPKIQTEPGSIKGDNYLSAIVSVTVRDEQGDKKLNIIAKKVLKGEETDQPRKKLNQLFSTEALVYQELLPAYRELQEVNNVKDPFRGSAEFYGAILDEEKETILMQNLKEDGFKLWQRQVPMDGIRVEIVIREYAKLHAASMAFKNVYPEKFEEYAERCKLSENNDDDKNSNGFVNVAEQVATMFENRQELKKSLDIFGQSMKSFLDDIRKEQQVFLHGDCWCNNILYKYEDPSSPNPTRVCFIDWQLARAGSPILDIAYFFIFNSTKEVLSDHNRYLRIYHDVLSQNLRELGLDPEKSFSFETLMDHWKKYAKFGVLMCILLLKMIVSDSQDIPDNFNDMVKLELSDTAETRYKERITNVIEFMAHNELA
ncbi:uncharacterized protein LOC132707386 [Cylas formicarius]|uniref:uncharacterized protein LOC132707386 n=1 Tax=Cylas formicarius TaxID=197179 RepID=UPI0029585C54|nr:uncharacterized protein LOC132707386 [Cylas formicarius]